MNHNTATDGHVPTPAVDVASLPWHQIPWGKGPIIWPTQIQSPGLDRATRRELATLVMISLIAIAWGLVAGSSARVETTFGVAVIGGAVACVCLRARARAPRTTRLLYVLVMVALVLSIASSGAGMTVLLVSGAPPPVVMVVALTSLTVYLILLRRVWGRVTAHAAALHDFAAHGRRAAQLDPSWDPEQRTFGAPGAGLVGALPRFSERNVALGTLGEQITASVLEHLCRMPGVRVVHGMRFPGSTRADIDHAVIAGNRVALIDSKLWKPALYELDPWRRILRSKQTHAGYRTSLGTAVERVRTLVPAAEVRGWIVVHPNAPGTVGLVNSCAFMRLVTAQTLLDEVGEWLAPQGNLVDRFVLEDVLNMRV